MGPEPEKTSVIVKWLLRGGNFSFQRDVFIVIFRRVNCNEE